MKIDNWTKMSKTQIKKLNHPKYKIIVSANPHGLFYVYNEDTVIAFRPTNNPKGDLYLKNPNASKGNIVQIQETQSLTS